MKTTEHTTTNVLIPFNQHEWKQSFTCSHCVFVIAGVCVFKNSASIHCRGSELWRDTRDCDQTVSGRVFNGLKPVTVFCDHAQCVHKAFTARGKSMPEYASPINGPQGTRSWSQWGSMGIVDMRNTRPRVRTCAFCFFCTIGRYLPVALITPSSCYCLEELFRVLHDRCHERGAAIIFDRALHNRCPFWASPKPNS